jgi:hypothetical protein
MVGAPAHHRVDDPGVRRPSSVGWLRGIRSQPLMPAGARSVILLGPGDLTIDTARPLNRL